SAKASARNTRSSRSKVSKKELARRGGKSSRKKLLARGRRMRPRYHSQPTMITSYGHGTGVHRYLTEVWTKSQNPSETGSGLSDAPTTHPTATMTPPVEGSNAAPASTPASSLQLSSLDASLVPI